MQETNQPLTVLPPVSQNVFIACKKCGVDRYHKVTAHVTDTSAKVQCEVCKSKKTFKLPKPKKPKAKKAKSKSKSSGPASPDWPTLKEMIGTANVQNYKMGENFKEKTALEHPKFGLGFVTMSTPQKIDVMFQDGLKSLVHNRGN